MGEMPFSSVLFEGGGYAAVIDSSKVPDFFQDLHLDQLISWILARREEYDLETCFYSPLRSAGRMLCVIARGIPGPR